MCRHSRRSFRSCAGITSAWTAGYPDHLPAEKIPLEVASCSADRFEALLVDRPDRAAVEAEAVRILQGAVGRGELDPGRGRRARRAVRSVPSQDVER
jgi:hypothetical protein